jgi:hypothetical protein
MVASAATKTPFYVKTRTTAMNLDWGHGADNTRILYKVSEQGTFEDASGAILGTFVFEIIEGVSAKTGLGTAAGHFVFNYATGEIIEGTVTAKLHVYPPPTLPEVDGRFEGHGDMHVTGDLYLNTSGLLVFDGYSW